MEAHLNGNNLVIENEAEFYKKILNTVGASIQVMRVDEDGKTLPVWTNEQYTKVIGYDLKSRQELGFDYGKNGLYHPDDIEMVHEAVHNVFTNRIDPEKIMMFRAKTPKGEWKWSLAALQNIVIGNEKLVVSFMVDITHKLQEYSVLVDRYAKEVSQLKNQLILNSLTKIEKEIIKELATGKTTREIADQRSRSYDTINNHKRNIYKKLYINKLNDLVSFANKVGLK